MQKINNNSIEKIKANFNCTWVYYYNHKQRALYAKPKDHHREFTTQFTALVIFIIPYNSLSLKNVTNVCTTPNKAKSKQRIQMNSF